MNLDPYLASVLADLDRATALADEQTRAVAAKVATAVEPALRLALVHALSDAAANVTSELTDAAVVVRMEGRDPVLAVHRTEAVPPAPPTPPAPPIPPHEPLAADSDDGETARVTVRLPQALKGQLDRLAAEAEVSLNTWIVQTLRRAISTVPSGTITPTIHSARRVTGWA
ncbi:toxin-antitoxin system HicB family antitoxin [Ornithinimicrobium pratense]|uniref:Toxin-antitoxin system HicB family antitoxin n=1 Tax=Ornithinimicrobium pratense TaxID=2593973 RepID=A0A5J6V8Q8_9MICO|nr:toxin-antitoxin system HicB family antitoxin [Ornithinimicrobium pratense]QFG69372.1 toxin-antitoxin system HicB family antitoxin [Ornithinimicrobium pratense]